MIVKRTVLTTIAAGMLAMTACSTESATAMTESSSPAPQPDSYGCADPASGASAALGTTLTADVSAAGNGIEVRYEVVNDGATPVYVVQQLPYPAFSMNYSPQNYYLTPGTDGVIEVAKREYWPPETCKVPMLYAPPPPALAVQLDPGARIAETFVVDRPVQVRNPYGDDVLTQLPLVPDPASRFRYCVGVAATATPVTEGTFPRDREYFRLARGEQQFLCSEPIDVS